MAWNDPDRNRSPWGNRPDRGAADLDEALRNLQRRLAGIFGGGGAGGGAAGGGGGGAMRGFGANQAAFEIGSAAVRVEPFAIGNVVGDGIDGEIAMREIALDACAHAKWIHVHGARLAGHHHGVAPFPDQDSIRKALENLAEGCIRRQFEVRSRGADEEVAQSSPDQKRCVSSVDHSLADLSNDARHAKIAHGFIVTGQREFGRR